MGWKLARSKKRQISETEALSPNDLSFQEKTSLREKNDTVRKTKALRRRGAEGSVKREPSGRILRR